LGTVGTGEEYSVFGASVNVASRLERSAPDGGILLSHATYQLVRGGFSVKPVGPIRLKGKKEPIGAYLVVDVAPRASHSSGRGILGVKTQMVGRAHEMMRLQQALKRSIQTGVGGRILISGEAGVGKSRLMHEYTNWVKSLPEEVMILKGRTDERLQEVPYSLMRDLVATHFGIQDTDQAAVVEEKLAVGISRYQDDELVDVRGRANAIGQLVGLSVSEQWLVSTMPSESPQVRDRVIHYLADLVEAISSEYPATLMFLEDLHWADERSLVIIERLSTLCERTPLLMICVARPQVNERSPLDGTVSGPSDNHADGLTPHNIELSALSDEESRQLVVEILHRSPQIPKALSDLIVARAEGNPYFVEELIKVLIEDEVIMTGEAEWRIRQDRYEDVRVPLTLTGVLQARLDRLSPLERSTLQRAAIFGREFWDIAVMRMGELSEQPVLPSDTLEALEALERRELVFKRQASGFAGSNAYIFKHAILRDVTYESVLLRSRPVYHRLAASWLSEQSGERIAEYAGLIAEHYELAGEHITAAQLYETAADRAREMYNPDIAIEYYTRSLSLLAEESQHSTWQLHLQQELGQLLRLQARMVEASQNYLTMQYIARMDGALDAQAHAWNGLALISREQGEHGKMLESATRAEEVARLGGSEEELLLALRYKGEAHFWLGDIDTALETGEKTLERSRRLKAPKMEVQALSFLCSVLVSIGNEFEASHYVNLLEELIVDVESDPASTEFLAFGKAVLGSLYNKLGSYDKATLSLLGALESYRDLDAQEAIANTLNRLGETGQLRGNPGVSIPLFREALSIADSIGDQYGELSYRTNLGGALLGVGKFKSATKELQQVTRLSKDAARFGSWSGLPKACSFLAEAYLGQKEIAEALTMALHAHDQARQFGESLWLAAAWRVLGMVAAELSPGELPLKIEEYTYDARGCFAESLNLLKRISAERGSIEREESLTLRAWAAYEKRAGNHEEASDMRARAESSALRLEGV
jgi:predicted ATPase